MNHKAFIFLDLALISFFLSQTGVDGLNIPELFTTVNSTVYIPCYVDTGTDHEHMTPTSWTRVAYDGFVHTLMAPDVVPSSNLELHASRIDSFDSLIVRNMVNSLSGTYTCHTDKGSASTLVHVLDGELSPIVSSIEPQKPSCSNDFELVHGKCLYYSNVKKNWRDAFRDCTVRTSSLITFKDVKDLMSFLLNLQKSGPTHYEFWMWTGHALIDESKGRFGALQNDAQVSPMLNKYWTTLLSCGRLDRVDHANISPLTGAECDSHKYNYLCEQPIH